MSGNNDTPLTEQEHKCPYCRSSINKHSLNCKHCQRDLSDFVSLENIDLTDIKSTKAILTILIRKAIWRDSIRVLLSSAIFVTLVSISISSYQKYSITEDLAERIKGEVKSELKNDVVQNVVANLKVNISNLEARIDFLDVKILKLSERYDDKVEKIDESITLNTEKLTSSIHQINATAIVAKKELESIEDDAQDLRKILNDYEADRDVVTAALLEMRKKSEKYEKKLHEFELDLLKKSNKLNPLLTSVNNLSGKFTKKLQDATAIATQLREIEIKFKTVSDRLAVQENRFIEYLTVKDLKEFDIEKDDVGKLQHRERKLIASYPTSSTTKSSVLVAPEVTFSWLNENNDVDNKFVLQIAQSVEALQENKVEEVLVIKGIAGNEQTVNTCEKSISLTKACITGDIFWRVGYQIDGGEVTDWSDVSNASVYFSTLHKVKSTGRVVIGYADNPPYFYETGNNLGGFEYKLSEKLFKELSLTLGVAIEPHYKKYEFNGLFDAIKDNSIDIIISSVSRTEIRKSLHGIDYSVPYMNSGISLVTKNKDINESVDFSIFLSTQVVAVEKDTIHSETARAYGAKVIELDSSKAAIDSMLTGDSSSALIDSRYIESTEFVAELNVVPIKDDNFGIVLKDSEQEFLQLINNGIKKLESEKSISKLQEEFFASLWL